MQQLFIVQIAYHGEMVCKVVVLASSIASAKTSALHDLIVQNKMSETVNGTPFVFINIDAFMFTIDQLDNKTFVI